MNSFEHDRIVPFSESNLRKKDQVSEMFDRIAFRYDFLNRLLSGGIDSRWRKKAIAQLHGVPHSQILDVATGTGEMALGLARLDGVQQITGVDLSEGMLQLGRQKVEKRGLSSKIFLQKGDGEHLVFASSTFDAITVAFGVRNFENLTLGLKEMYRVLKPGGKLVILEFSKPSNPVFLAFYRFYMRAIAPTVVHAFSKKQAYQYLDRSVRAFPQGASFLDILKEAGFLRSYAQPLTMGICTIYTASKA